MKKKRLGEVLCERGHVSLADLHRALHDQRGKVVHLGELMLQRGLVSKSDLGAALADVTGVPYFDCTSAAVSSSVLDLIPDSLARRCHAIPLEVADATLTVVMSEPQNLKFLEDLRFKTNLKICPRLGFQQDIEAAIERLYGRPPTIHDSADHAAEAVGMEFISSSAQQRNVEAMCEIQAELQQKSKTTPAVQVVASMIRDAVAKQASDIHIEPQSAETIVRFRVDGILRDYTQVPRVIQNAVVSRIKILSDMDIAERRAPQDGRFLVRLNKRRIDLRVSTLPTQYGEKVVMRLLESESPINDFAALGFPPQMAADLRRILRFPQGMLLVTGPTGSGKSTTLYSSLNFVRRPSINIVTVEDPVEYAVAGVNQVQVNVNAGLTFASCLRSILRQDPNVIMVGEIRDRETAEIALKAAQTGHLVLSTLHTNDSVSAITRLLDIGMAPFQIANSVSAIIAQRLIRRLCACHTTSAPSQEFISEIMLTGAAAPDVQAHATGCEQCDLTGYKGRMGIYEMLIINDPIRQAIRSGDGNEEIRALGQHNGMRLMQEQAIECVRQGLTTLEEIQRVVPFEQNQAVLCSGCHRELPGTFVFCPLCGDQRPGMQPVRPARARSTRLRPLIREAL